MIAVLYARTHSGSLPVSKNAFREIVQDQWDVSAFRFDDAFSNLQRWKYLKNESADESEPEYRLSSSGIDWFESWYRLQWNSNSNFSFFQVHDGVVMVDETRSQYLRRIEAEKLARQAKGVGSVNWTKWGAILTGIGIIIAIIVALLK